MRHAPVPVRERCADRRDDRRREVALLAIPGLAPFEFGVICEVFGIDRSAMGGPAFEFVIATAHPGAVRQRFVKVLQVSPLAYRRAFGAREAG